MRARLSYFIHQRLTHNTAAGLKHDADDTAKALLALSLCNNEFSVEPCVREFDAGTHFRTFAGERDASISANCNVFMALIHQKESKWSPAIEKCARFLCEHWWRNGEDVRDKWVRWPLKDLIVWILKGPEPEPSLYKLALLTSTWAGVGALEPRT